MCCFIWSCWPWVPTDCHHLLQPPPHPKPSNNNSSSINKNPQHYWLLSILLLPLQDLAVRSYCWTHHIPESKSTEKSDLSQGSLWKMGRGGRLWKPEKTDGYKKVGFSGHSRAVVQKNFHWGWQHPQDLCKLKQMKSQHGRGKHKVPLLVRATGNWSPLGEGELAFFEIVTSGRLTPLSSWKATYPRIYGQYKLDVMG